MYATKQWVVRWSQMLSRTVSRSTMKLVVEVLLPMAYHVLVTIVAEWRQR